MPAPSLKPEAMERTLFVSGLLLLPALLVGYSLLLRIVAGGTPPASRKSPTFLSGGWGVATVAVLAWTIVVMARNPFYLRSLGDPGAGAFLTALAALVFAATVLRLLLTEGSGGAERFAAGFLRSLALLLVGIVGVSTVFGLRAVTASTDYTASFNAVFHAVVQVFQGKTLLVDLNHQYGLYPQFLEPVFKLFGLSVLKFTLAMATLNVASLLLLYRFLEEIAANAVIRHLGFAALVSGSLLSGESPRPDLFFQYYPLRLIFPALVVFLTHRALRRKERRWYYASLAAASFALLWNADTGLVVFVAWTATMTFDACCAREYRKALQHLLRTGAGLALVYLSCTVYLRLRSGGWPDFGEQFLYQDLFYLCGYMMEPMPLAHPWNIVLLVYAAGLLCAVTSLVAGIPSARVSAVFFLSVMGAGIFSYYQGRSVDSNLMVYPAILVTVVFADTLSRRARDAGSWREKLLLASILATWTLSLAGLARNLPEIGVGTRERLARTFGGEETPLTRDIAMVKRHFAPGQEVLILSGHSGIYYLETGTRPPLRLAGSTEIVLANDYLRLDLYLHAPETKSVVFDRSIGNDNMAAVIHQAFRVKESSPDLLVTVLTR